jgi:hypothetical protein
MILNPNIQYEVGTEEAIRRFEPYELDQFSKRLKSRLSPRNIYQIRIS